MYIEIIVRGDVWWKLLDKLLFVGEDFDDSV